MSDNDRTLTITRFDFVPGSSVTLEPVKSIEGTDESGHLEIKPLMVGTDVLVMEAHREKGLVDPEHIHDDHESICYLVRGRMRVVIDGQEFIAHRKVFNSAGLY